MKRCREWGRGQTTRLQPFVESLDESDEDAGVQAAQHIQMALQEHLEEAEVGFGELGVGEDVVERDL
jgi:hypothetical protein